MDRPQLKTPWWHKSAACLGTDSDLFFMGRGGTIQRARAFCAPSARWPAHGSIGRSARARACKGFGAGCRLGNAEPRTSGAAG